MAAAWVEMAWTAREMSEASIRGRAPSVDDDVGGVSDVFKARADGVLAACPTCADGGYLVRGGLIDKGVDGFGVPFTRDYDNAFD